jgi:hypothetical protein
MATAENTDRLTRTALEASPRPLWNPIASHKEVKNTRYWPKTLPLPKKEIALISP